MPKNGAQLSSDNIEIFKEWIEQGCLKNNFEIYGSCLIKIIKGDFSQEKRDVYILLFNKLNFSLTSQAEGPFVEYSHFLPLEKV